MLRHDLYSAFEGIKPATVLEDEAGIVSRSRELTQKKLSRFDLSEEKKATATPKVSRTASREVFFSGPEAQLKARTSVFSRKKYMGDEKRCAQFELNMERKLGDIDRIL